MRPPPVEAERRGASPPERAFDLALALAADVQTRKALQAVHPEWVGKQQRPQAARPHDPLQTVQAAAPETFDVHAKGREVNVEHGAWEQSMEPACGAALFTAPRAGRR